MQTYFKNKRALSLLAEQPGIIDKSVKDSKVHRGYGIHMAEQIKRDAEIYLRDWLLTERGRDENDNPILNLHTLRSIPLIQELIAYDPKDGNYDRAIAIMLVMLHMKEREQVAVLAETADYAKRFQSGIFSKDRTLFKKRGRHSF
jgi:hypothetical protein